MSQEEEEADRSDEVAGGGVLCFFYGVLAGEGNTSASNYQQTK